MTKNSSGSRKGTTKTGLGFGKSDLPFSGVGSPPPGSGSISAEDLSGNPVIDAIIDNLRGIFFFFDDKGKIIKWNKKLEDITGFSPEDLKAMAPADFFPAPQAEFIQEKIREIKANGEALFEAEASVKNGPPIPCSFKAARIDIGGKTCFLGTAIDLSSSRQARKSLSEAEARYSAFIEHSSDGFWHLELKKPIRLSLSEEDQIEELFEQSYIAECNNVKATQYGFDGPENLIGKTLDDLLLRSETVNEVYLRKFILSGYKLIDHESHEKDANGEDRYYLSNLIGVVEDGCLVRAWGTQRDITAIKQARQTYLESEEHLRRSQKVEAIGRLAGGIAHDFNNFLAVIMLHVDMLNLQLPANSPLRFRIDEIKSVTNNAAGMVRQLLAFGRKQTLQPQPVVLNQVILEFMKMLRPLIGEDIEVELALEEQLGVCLVDPDQVTQVLMNLAVNARDAMPKGGALRITTSNIALDKNRIRLRSQPVGEYVELAVSDTGIGMDTATRKRIFEPFFTTKAPNKGTGLGLSTVYGIVKQSNGFIWVETEPKKGARFEVQFPRIDQPARELIKEEAINMPTGSETILLVEDEEPLRRATVEALSVLGYRVFEAGNGEEAIKVAESCREPLHLLLTDVVMPKMNGRELAEKIKTTHPGTAVLFISGYNNDIISDHGILEDNVNFLSKPFSPLILADKIREVLEKSKAANLPLA